MTAIPNQVLVNFRDVDVQSCPFGAYDLLRAEHPVYRDPGTGYYVVIDHALLRQIAKDTQRFSSQTGLIQVRSGALGERIQKMQRESGVRNVPVLLTTDPPEHGFYRSLVDRAFSPARIKKLETFLTESVDAIIDTFIERGRLEFVQDMAVMVPVNVVAALLGVSTDRADDIKRWSDSSSGATDPTLSDETKLEMLQCVCELQRFLLDQANEYRERPNDSLLSALANAEINGRQLTDEEVVSIAQQIIIAGHETTASVMASGMLWLINTPGLEQRLRNDPTLLPNFVEEVLRLEAPLQGMFRRTTTDVELAGTHIAAGSIVVMRWGAANRDPERFENACALDLDRPNLREHLSFGFGPHFCIGNQLARAELRIAFDRMLRRMANFRLTDGPDGVVRLSHYFIYGIKHMNVQFDRI